MGESVQTIRHSLHVGSEKNYWSVNYDGVVRFHGKGTTWDDIQTSIVGLRLSSAAGKVDNNYLENSVTFNPGGVMGNVNDMVGMNVQYPHKAREDGEFRLHVHWWQPDATVRTFTVRYRLQGNGQTKETNWTTVVIDTDSTNNVFEYPGTGTINQITKLVDIDMTGASISTLLQIQLVRSDSETGDIDATFLDLHYEIDSAGSDEEFIKG